MVPPGAAQGEAVVLRASASAVTFQGFLAAYAPQHFRRGAAPGAGADKDDAGGEEAAEGGPGGGGAADEELSATLMRLAVRLGQPVLRAGVHCMQGIVTGVNGYNVLGDGPHRVLVRCGVCLALHVLNVFGSN